MKNILKSKKGFTRSSTMSSTGNEKASREVVVGGADTALSKTTPLPFASKRRDGFTLIEMLIVIAIIGILASILLVGLGTFRGRGRDARRVSDLRQTQNALELYFNSNGAYPNATDWPALRAALIGGNLGISNIPNDPTPGQSYGYCNSGSRYVLGANLEDAANPTLRDQEGVDFTSICTFSVTPTIDCHDTVADGNAGYCVTL